MKPRDTNSHDELFQLLPWYANKSLQGVELKAVESHLSVCLVCKRELVQLQKLAQAVIQEGSLDSAAQASFTRLKSRLHNQPTISAKVAKVNPATDSAPNGINQIGAPRKQGQFTISKTYPALAVAATLMLSVTLWMPRFAENDMQPNNSFKTLSDGRQERTNTNEIRVVFAENIDQQQKTKILEQIHGMFVGSPTAQGVYTVRLDKGIAAKSLIDIVESLRKDSNIIFAEPSYSLLSSMAIEK